jgi:hypothetical protein
MQAHMQLDIDTKVMLLNGVVEDPTVVAKMIQRAPCILTFSEVALQVSDLRSWHWASCSYSVQ